MDKVTLLDYRILVMKYETLEAELAECQRERDALSDATRDFLCCLDVEHWNKGQLDFFDDTFAEEIIAMRKALAKLDEE